MMKLDKGEKSLWQMPFEMYLIYNNQKCDVETFMLTSTNIRIEYLKKISFFNKEPVNIVIPLELIRFEDDVPSVDHRYIDDETVEVRIASQYNDYSVMVTYNHQKAFEKQFNEFIEKLMKTVKKNGVNIT